jgi:hypothetical protein
VNIFADLKSSSSNAPKEETKAVVRIEFLAGHLAVLDAKFSSLLQFQALLMVVTAILNVLYKDDPNKASWFGFPLVAFIVFSFLTTMLCLLGAGWFFWGEMSGTPVVDKAREHVGGMIYTVIDRTAIFRYAWMLTFFTVCAFILLAGAISNWSLFGSLENELRSIALWSGLIALLRIVSLGSLVGLIVVACHEPRNKGWLIFLGTVSFSLNTVDLLIRILP